MTKRFNVLAVAPVAALAGASIAVGIVVLWEPWEKESQPAAGRIAFTGCEGYDSCSIYVINADGSGETRLTNNQPGSESSSPLAWSPDGARLAFVSLRDGNHEIYVMNADGSGQTNLTNNPANDSTPAWSPDGRRIAFVTGRDAYPIERPPGSEIHPGEIRIGIQQVYVMDADGSDQTRFTEIVSIGGAWGPAWSPDGNRIAFTSDGGSAGGSVWIMKADGSDKITLGSGGGAVWSPDGARLAFGSPTTFQYASQQTIYVVDADGSGRVRLATGAYGPAWSPDGSRIAFTQTRQPPDSEFLANEIFVMNSDGSDQTRLTKSVGWQPVPVWSPDGSHIALSDSTFRFDIYVMDADGSNVTRLANQVGRVIRGVAWSPVP